MRVKSRLELNRPSARELAPDADVVRRGLPELIRSLFLAENAAKLVIGRFGLDMRLGLRRSAAVVIPSACSLRSAHCAALIALAAAAGLARVEWESFAPSTDRGAELTNAAPAASVAPKRAPDDEAFAGEWAASVRAGWMRLSAMSRALASSGRGAESVGGAGSPGIAPSPRDVVAARRAVSPEIPKFFEGSPGMPTARAHSFPFAVGPPFRGAGCANLRAADTQVPDDSAARSGFLQRVVRVCVFPARETRTAGPSASPVKPHLSPSFALRGEPGSAIATFTAADHFARCRRLRVGTASPFAIFFPSTHETSPLETLDCA